MISHFNEDTIAFPHQQARPWELSIDTDNVPCVAQSCHVVVLNLNYIQQAEPKIRTGKLNIIENMNTKLVCYSKVIVINVH